MLWTHSTAGALSDLIRSQYESRSVTYSPSMILCLFMYIPQVPYKTTNYLVEVLILNERGKDMNRSLGYISVQI